MSTASVKRVRKNGKGSKWIRVATRLAIYHRDGWRCVYCRSGLKLTLDHVKPKATGGTNKPFNLVTCCYSCNSSKQDRSPKAWFKDLRARGVNTETMRKRLYRLRHKPIDRGVFLKLVKDKVPFEQIRDMMMEVW
jgi:5-methylcytosine-specific restriction endonuclease McrA